MTYRQTEKTNRIGRHTDTKDRQKNRQNRIDKQTTDRNLRETSLYTTMKTKWMIFFNWDKISATVPEKNSYFGHTFHM